MSFSIRHFAVFLIRRAAQTVTIHHVNFSRSVCALCRELSILPPRPISISDAQLIEVLLTPSPTRFQLLCNTFGTVCLELKGELEELKPLSKSTLEETKYLHILEFIHDVGIFDNGEEADLAKIKGYYLPVKVQAQVQR